MTTTTYQPFRVQIKYAKRGEMLSTSWRVPSTWTVDSPSVEHDLGTPFKEVILGVTKRTRAGSTGRVSWMLIEDDDIVRRGYGTVDEMSAELSTLHLAI